MRSKEVSMHTSTKNIFRIEKIGYYSEPSLRILRFKPIFLIYFVEFGPPGPCSRRTSIDVHTLPFLQKRGGGRMEVQGQKATIDPSCCKHLAANLKKHRTRPEPLACTDFYVGIVRVQIFFASGTPGFLARHQCWPTRTFGRNRLTACLVTGSFM